MSNELLIGLHKCCYSTWDTEYFGVETGKVTLNGPVNDDEMREIEKWIKTLDFVTIYNVGNNPINNIKIAHLRLVLLLTDINIRFCRNINELALGQPLNHHNILIESMSELDEGVISVANSCFAHSRFYNEPNLPIDKAKGIYVHWVTSAFNRSDRFFAKLIIQNTTRAFILFSIDLSEKTSVIELIGVCPQFTGMKLGTTLLNNMVHYVSKYGVTKIQVGTQVNNVGAIRFYQCNGFTFEGCTTVFHVWPKKGREGK